MIEVIAAYLLISFGFYLGAAFVNIKSFKDADTISILRGLAGALVWPYFIGMIIFYGMKGILK